MRRASSLLGLDPAIERELDTKYALVKSVADHLDSIEAVATEDLAALTAALNEAKDFTGITVVSGSPASWDVVNKILTVPTVKGDTGASPQVAMSYNAVTGDLEYEVTYV